MPSFHLRPATPEDAAALLAIYRPYVLHTAITFEYDVPTFGIHPSVEATLRTTPIWWQSRQGNCWAMPTPPPSMSGQPISGPRRAPSTSARISEATAWAPALRGLGTGAGRPKRPQLQRLHRPSSGRRRHPHPGQRPLSPADGVHFGGAVSSGGI